MKISQSIPASLLLVISSYLGAQEASSQAEASLQAQQPDSGQLLQEIRQQQLHQSLSDGIRTQPRTEPDQPYLVVGGGMALPEDLCTADPQGCVLPQGGH